MLIANLADTFEQTWLPWLVFCLFALGVLWVTYFNKTENRRTRRKGERALDSVLSELDANEPGWRWEDRQPIPEERNTCRLLIEFGERHQEATNPAWKRLKALEVRLDQIGVNQRLPEQLRAEMREVLAELAPSLEAVREAVRLGDCQRPLDPAPDADALTDLVEPLQGLEAMCGLLPFQGRCRLAEGEPGEAFRCVSEILDLADQLKDEGPLMDQVTRVAMLIRASVTLEEILAKAVCPDGQQLAAIQHRLRELTIAPIMLSGFVRELGYAHRMSQEIGSGKLSLERVQTWAGDSSDIARLARRLWGSPHAPASEALTLRTLIHYIAPLRGKGADTVEPLPRIPALPEYDMARHDAGMFAAVFRAESLHRSRLRAAWLALAAERYRLRHGSWPPRLSELQPEFAANIPADPFGAGTLRRTPVEEGFVVHGADHPEPMNLEGMPTAMAFFSSPNSIGFRLWNPEFRGVALPS